MLHSSNKSEGVVAVGVDPTSDVTQMLGPTLGNALQFPLS